MLKRENSGIAVLLGALPQQLSPEQVGDSVRVLQAERPTYFRPIWAGQGFPSDVNRALDTIEHDAESTPVLTARRLSPNATKLLEERGISWADAAGYAKIAVPPGLFVSRLRPKPLRESAIGGVTWSRSAEIVAEYILSRRAQSHLGAVGGVDRVAHIAEATGVSNAQASKVLIMLDDEGFTAKFGPERGPTSAREYRDASGLLSEWAGHYTRAVRKERRVELHVPWRDHGQSIGLAENMLHGIRWAVSGWAAAEVIAPFANQVPDLMVYVPDEDFDRATEQLKGTPDVTEVDRGGRIHLRAVGEYVFEFKRTEAFTPTVSTVRVYADLIGIGGRGAEAAEHLREVAIGF